MDAADAIVAELVRPEPLGLVLGRAREHRLGALDERADDVRLTAVVEMPPESGIGFRAPLLAHPGRDDRLAVGGRGRDLRHREVAVHREGERSRDRRRRHVEDVRAPPLGKRGPLLDAEAVLLVDDGDREVRELDLALDQRVRADRNADVARGDQLVRRASLAGGDARREQRDPDAELGAEPLDREEVLLGKGLGRRHQRALPPALDRPEERVERDRRLARADVALEETLHRRRPGEVGVDLLDGVVLRARERERQGVAVPLERAPPGAAAPRRRAPRAPRSGGGARAGA